MLVKIFLRPDDDPQKIASALFDFRKGLKKLRDDADELANLKERGRKALDADVATQQEFDKLLEHCASSGLFIVPVGELESWLLTTVLQGVPIKQNGLLEHSKNYSK